MEERYRIKVSTMALVEHDGKMLAVREQIPHNDPNAPIVLNQPGGHMDPGETVFESVVRECLEETGYTVKPVAVLSVYQNIDSEYLTISFICELEDVERIPVEAPEIKEVVWLSRGEIAEKKSEHRSPRTSMRFNDYFEGQRMPLSTIKTKTP